MEEGLVTMALIPRSFTTDAPLRETLPVGFQRSEFLLEHGDIDMIIDRRDMRDRIASLLAKLTHQPEP